MQNSLMILGHPRSMTSVLYLVTEKVLFHDLLFLDPRIAYNPELKMVGEILNRSKLVYRGSDRLFPLGVVEDDRNPVYYHKDRGAFVPLSEVGLQTLPDIRDTVFGILDAYRGGYLVKTVSQPWLVTEYLKENPQAYKVLFIQRNLVDVAFRMFSLGWMFPVAHCSVGEHQDLKRMLARGLLRTQRLFDSCSFDAKLDWHDLIYNPDQLWAALRGMGYQPRTYEWLNANQKAIRDQRIQARNEPLWGTFKRILEEEGYTVPD